MEKESLIAALREAEAAKFASVPAEDAVEHVFSAWFRKRMRRLIRLQRFPLWRLFRTPRGRAALMFFVLIAAFGVRPDQNPLFRYAFPSVQLQTASVPASTPVQAVKPASAQGVPASLPQKPGAAARADAPVAGEPAPAEAALPAEPAAEAVSFAPAPAAPVYVPPAPVTEPEPSPPAAPIEEETHWVAYQPLPGAEPASEPGTDGAYQPLPSGEPETEIETVMGSIVTPVPIHDVTMAPYSGEYGSNLTSQTSLVGEPRWDPTPALPSFNWDPVVGPVE